MVQKFRFNKKQKKEHLAPITLGYLFTHNRLDIEKELKRIKILFDSGASVTLINADLVKNLTKERTQKVAWHTKSGSFCTDKICNICFMLLAFHTEKL
jgi:hypothetical protein